MWHIKNIGKLNMIGSDNGILPSRCQVVIWTNAGIRTLGTNFSEIFRKIDTFSFKKMHLKMSSGKCLPFCFGLNLIQISSMLVEYFIQYGVMFDSVTRVPPHWTCNIYQYCFLYLFLTDHKLTVISDLMIAMYERHIKYMESFEA